MKKFTKVLLVASLLAGAGVSQSALAVTPTLPASSGSLVPTSTLLDVKPDGNGGFNSNFGNSYGKFISGSSGPLTINKLFSDSYTFTVGGASETAGTVSAGFTSSQDVYIKSFDIYTSAGVLAVQGMNELAASNKPGKNDFWSLPEDATLGAGNYYLKITGQVLGTAGGSYGGSLNVTSSVPETNTYAMLLAGLGMVGFVGRRKAKKTV